ncbi:DUF4384 domain-containing protein [candidate division KSB1 bacterium]|nr:DUF4384 domain-containing protein [candidate division KSB1 bacterium]
MRKALIFMILMALIVSGSAYLKADENASDGKRSIIVEADGYVYLSEDKTMRQLRNEARMEAKRLALEQGEMYIKNVTKVENYTLVSDVIESKGEGLIKILDSKDYGIQPDNRWRYWIKAEIRYIIKEKQEPIKIKPSEESHPTVENRKQDSTGPLTVKIWAAKDVYEEGEKMTFFMRGNIDFYARIIYVDATGQRLQLVPNRYENNNFFKGGQTIEFPRKSDKYELTVAPPFGKESVIVYASTSPQGDIDLKQTESSYYTVEDDLNKLGYKTRGVKIGKRKGAEFFETSCAIKTAK